MEAAGRWLGENSWCSVRRLGGSSFSVDLCGVFFCVTSLAGAEYFQLGNAVGVEILPQLVAEVGSVATPTAISPPLFIALLTSSTLGETRRRKI